MALPAAPGSAATAAGTLHEVTFGGAASVTIPAGQSVLSDPVALAVPANHDLLVTTYKPGDPTPFTYRPDAQEYSFYTSGADAADATSAAAFPETTASWYLLTGVQVTGPGPAGPGARGDVVAFGDSITDGYQSSYDLNARWPNILADRLLALPARDQLGVLNAGIRGNRILLDGGNGFGPAAVSRFQRDSQSGTSDQLTMHVFAATVPVEPARTVTSVTLPDIGYTVAPSVPALHIFSLALFSLTLGS